MACSIRGVLLPLTPAIPSGLEYEQTQVENSGASLIMSTLPGSARGGLQFIARLRRFIWWSPANIREQKSDNESTQETFPFAVTDGYWYYYRVFVDNKGAGTIWVHRSLSGTTSGRVKVMDDTASGSFEVGAIAVAVSAENEVIGLLKVYNGNSSNGDVQAVVQTAGVLRRRTFGIRSSWARGASVVLDGLLQVSIIVTTDLGFRWYYSNNAGASYVELLAQNTPGGVVFPWHTLVGSDIYVGTRDASNRMWIKPFNDRMSLVPVPLSPGAGVINAQGTSRGFLVFSYKQPPTDENEAETRVAAFNMVDGCGDQNLVHDMTAAALPERSRRGL
jgi:hypothetical protein